MASHIIEKIRKLLALAGSANENEATLAMQRATELMDANGIENIELLESSPLLVGETTCPLHTRNNVRWRSTLAMAAAMLFDSKVYLKQVNQSATIVFCGTDSNRAASVTFWRYLEQCAETATTIASRNLLATAGSRRKFLGDFRYGFAVRVYNRANKQVKERLYAQRRSEHHTAEPNARYAVICADTRIAVANYIDQLGLTKGRAHRREVGHGFEQGRQAGDAVALGGQLAPSNQPRLTHD